MSPGDVGTPAANARRTVFVIALGVLVLGLTVPNVFVSGIQVFAGVDTDAGTHGAHVTYVVPDSPAEKAGLRADDIFDLPAMTFSQRTALYADEPLAADRSVTIPIVRGSQKLAIHVSGTRQNGLQIQAIVKRCAATFFVLLAAVLLLLRPSRMLWGFYLFALGSVGAVPLAYLPSLSGWAKFGVYELLFALYYTGFYTAGLLIFTTRFPGDANGGWRRWVDRLAVPLAVVLALLSLACDAYVDVFAASVPGGLWNALDVLKQATLVLGVFSLFGALLEVGSEQRQRLQWVAAAVIAYVFVDYYLEDPALSWWPAAFSNAGISPGILDATQVLIPIAVAYAVLKHRVIDVRFAISRAVIYGSSIAVLALCVGLLQVAVSESFHQAPFGYFIEVVLAVGVGAVMLPLSRIAGSSIERRIFARQSRARAQLARVAKGLPYADSAEEIGRVLTMDASRNLELSAAALFRRRDGTFVPETAVGWEHDALSEPDAGRIKLAFEGEGRMLRLSHLEHNVPAIVAYPVYARRHLRGFVLYSAHDNGTDLDPDEIALLDDLTQNASRGYDALELAERVRVANEEQARAQIQHIAELERFNEAQGRFVPHEFLELLEKQNLTDVALGDSTLRTMTVLFSDIRSFTTISEGMSPSDIFALLNRYLHRAEPIISENGGFIDKYIGDAVMGLFPNAADDALRAGIELQREVRVFNRKLADEGMHPLAIGVGLHTGELMLGTIGGRNRMETTVIADAVNAASRLEGATKTFGCSILLSRETCDALLERDRFQLRQLGAVHVKGKSEKLHVYEAFDADTADLILHKRSTAIDFAEALLSFEAGEFLRAREGFAAIASANQADGASRYYAAQCEELLSSSTTLPADR